MKLTPDARKRADQFLRIAEILGISVFITCTLRTNKEQNRLWAIGRTIPGKIVTRARGGQSKHNPGPDGLSRAFDVAFRPEDDPKGATWEGPWDELGVIAGLVGLDWGGDWVSYKDYPHFEI
jgi:peptidoglycan L-alanyl-D-glutamate endopeptidase CwlK